ncbi:MAG: GntR family transcriptional regulator [Rhizobiaceae bacterium]|jgi:DNA-binding GntR family transcriptional regulator|nr:GntR family transcriptional regulator [Rhizobiaceae bacterium]
MKPDSGKEKNGLMDYQDAQFETVPLSNQVEKFLVRELMRGHLSGGQRVNEAEMARKLGISRNPIREAVRRLEERGVLVSIPRKGTFVRSFTRKNVDDIYSFRQVVEKFSLENGLSRMTDDMLEELSQVVKDMEEAARNGDEVTLVEKDLEFHNRICRLPSNHQSLHAFLNIEAELQLLIKIVDQRFESLHAAAADHWPVVEALATRKLDVAQDALRSHIDDSWRRLSEAFTDDDEQEQI